MRSLPFSKTIYAVLVCCFAFIQTIDAQDADPKNWTLNGYVKQLQSVYKLDGLDSYLLDNLVHNRLNFKWYPSAAFTVRVEVRNRLFYGDLVKLTPDYGAQIEASNTDLFDLSFHTLEREGMLINTNIDRLFLEYNKGNLEVRVGRQRINWGISNVWNPNDVFNAFSFTDFDYEERPGSDAARIKYYTGTTSSIEFAINGGRTWSDRVVAALFKWNVANYDFQLLSGVVKNEWVIGGGWAGNLGNAGLKGEWTYFKPLEADLDASFAMTSAVDYSFANSLYASIGYLYTSNAATAGSLADLFSFQLSAKNLYPFRHAVFISTSYPITPLISGSIAWIYSPIKSHPLFINPTLTWSIAQSWDLDMVGQVAFSKTGSAYTTPVKAAFLRLKISF